MSSSGGLSRFATVTVIILLPTLVLFAHLNSIIVIQEPSTRAAIRPTSSNTSHSGDADVLNATVVPVPVVIYRNLEAGAVGSNVIEVSGYVNYNQSRPVLGNVSQNVEFRNTSSVSKLKVAKRPTITANNSKVLYARPVVGDAQTRVIITSALNSSKVPYCKKTTPAAIIVGIQKCGTSALGKFLDLHPQVNHAKGEVNYFSSHYSLGLDWYKNRLPCAMPGQIVTEKSPGYFYRKVTPRRIYDLKEDIKLIIIVKDPIVRAQSNYAMSHGTSASGFQENILKSNGEIDPQSHVIDFSLYSLYVKPWLDVFPLDRICFIDGHNLERNPEAEMKKLETFLNISSFFRSSHFVLDAKKGKPCFYKRGQKHCLSESKGREHPSVTEKLQKKLEEFFHPLNEKFFSMINRRFEWGY